MKSPTRPVAAYLALAALSCLASCVMLEEPALTAPLWQLISHERLLVSVPAATGAIVGGLAGVPLALIALPATVPTSIAMSDGGMMLLLPLMPALAVAEAGAILVGGPAWLLFGWW